ncbi:alanine:cation symporter family protein [Sinomicrobium pectinilyticum]|uniref:Alanine:cation symporter family protein n=1 Tax=Sinomicrobium pectinilyticum TaxID=1084421 RepID=A0A3N0E454_SINP1|nr:alanine/glycine:cation symporter family protein [Sinomicrobium pectinilyticum]RNL82626.1 alanine:cation symporter family protein [Sinomicrobium pectinilyticum]
MEEIIKSINAIVWSNALVILCLGAGIYFSVVTGFLQVRYIREMVKLLFAKESSNKGVTSFQAFAIAISGRVGTGNIAGVATAIASGGPGAVFWMWVIALLGAASAYVEATLGQIYKEVKDGQYRGGPAFYIEKGLKTKAFGVLFAVVTIASTAFFLPGVQSNSIAQGIEEAFRFPVWATGIGISVLLALIIFGGIKRISKVAEIVVPFMAIGYILMALIVIGMNIEKVPEMFSLIFRSAFGAEEMFAGIFGSAIAWGVKRGIYSNEAGQGTAPHAAAAAEVSHPAKQGLVQAFSVYVDTLFVCTATALMILFTNSYNVKHPDIKNEFIVQNLDKNVEAGPAFTQAAIAHHFPTVGAAFVAISLMFFAFTTIMAYYYIAETNLSYLDRKGSQIKLLILRLVLLFSVFYGSVKSAQLAWDMGDIGVGLMAWINIIFILILQRPALKALKDYKEQRKKKKDPVFDPEKLGIRNADFWKTYNRKEEN